MIPKRNCVSLLPVVNRSGPLQLRPMDEGRCSTGTNIMNLFGISDTAYK